MFTLAGVIRCSVGSWPVKYLGLPLGRNPLQAAFWDPVVARVAKRLDGWKKAFLSQGGKLTLIQSVLANLPIFYLSVFRIPVGVANVIEKLMRDIFWERYSDENLTHLVAWEQVSKPKELRGLGIVNLRKKNEALLAKWWWRFPLETEALWHKIIIGKYGLNHNRWDSGVASMVTFRCPWKSVQAVADIFSKGLNGKLDWEKL